MSSGTVTPSGYVLTPEQLEKQERRKQEKLAKKLAAAAAGETAQPAREVPILKRSWLDVGSARANANPRIRVSIATWNILAQTLVRRTLFPGSDCLKWKDREQILTQEMRTYACDIVCLQECDKLEEILQHLPDHRAVSAKGPRKLHGLAILYRHSLYEVKATKTVRLDDEFVLNATETIDVASLNQEERIRRRGGTRQTKNIGLVAALRRRDDPSQGIVIGTTHLFWHPDYVYERCRQSLILARAIKAFRKAQGPHWPAFLAGDFNTQPSEPAYQLLLRPSKPLDEQTTKDIEGSSVIHTSATNIDPLSVEMAAEDARAANPIEGGTETIDTNGDQKDDEGDEEDGDDKDAKNATDETGIKNTRFAQPADGLVKPKDFEALAKQILPDGGMLSCFGNTDWQSKVEAAETFGGRVTCAGAGAGEPAWTLYSPLFRLTLDYVLLFPAEEATADNAPQFEVTRLLTPPKAEQLEPGLPRKSISASDHVMMAVEGYFGAAARDA